MKTLKGIVVFLLAVLPFQPCAADNIVMEGWMTHDMPLMAVEDPGMLSCPGGTLVPHPMMGFVCSPGANIHVRDMLLTVAVDGSSDYVIGTGHINANINWDDDGEGPYSGDFSIDVANHDFTWVGTWTGKRKKSEDNQWISTLNGTAYATGPAAPPYQLKFDMTYTSKALYPASYEMLNMLLGTNFTGPEGEGTFVLKYVDE